MSPGSAMSARVICFSLGACGSARARRSLRWTPGTPRPPRSTESSCAGTWLTFPTRASISRFSWMFWSTSETIGTLSLRPSGKLRPGGRLLVTVPAFGFLFSAHDVRLKHLRRYRRGRLNELLQGLDVESAQSFHFFTSLFLVRCAQFLLSKLGCHGSREHISTWRFSERHPTTRCVAAILRNDFALNRWLAGRGLRLPGLSICLTARKKLVS